MSSKIRLIVSLSIFALVLFVITTPIEPVTASPERAVTPSTFITLPATSFIPDENSYYDQGYYYIASHEADAEFYAPIVLPDGATLRKIVISYLDNTNLGTVKAEMRRLKLSTRGLGYLGSIESDPAGYSAFLQQMTLQVNKLINRYYVYTLHITMDSACEIYGVRVEYAMP